MSIDVILRIEDDASIQSIFKGGGPISEEVLRTAVYFFWLHNTLLSMGFKNINSLIPVAEGDYDKTVEYLLAAGYLETEEK